MEEYHRRREAAEKKINEMTLEELEDYLPRASGVEPFYSKAERATWVARRMTLLFAVSLGLFMALILPELISLAMIVALLILMAVMWWRQ